MTKFKVGDKVRCVDAVHCRLVPGKEYTVLKASETHISFEDNDEFGWLWRNNCFELVESASSNLSPIRKVTRTEIVPGTYGDVKVFYDNPGIFIEYSTYSNPVNLRNAARIFNEIADALEQNKEASS